MSTTFKQVLSNIYDGSISELENYLRNAIDKGEKVHLVTANSEILTLAINNKEIMNMLYSKDTIIVADGISVVWAVKKTLKKRINKITGVDILSFLIQDAHKNNLRMGFLGGSEETIGQLSKLLKSQYYNCKVVGMFDGYSEDKTKRLNEIIVNEADIIAVALGVPKQEMLIYENINKSSEGIYIGVGGAFDVLSGCKKRAPKIFIKMNLEWLYRIMMEPRRIGRFIKYNLKFVLMTLSQK